MTIQIKNISFLNKSTGFTLIELLVAMAVLAFGALGFFYLQGQATRTRTFAREMTRAVNIAQSQMEILKTLDYNNNLLYDDAGDTNPTKYPNSTGTIINFNASNEKYYQFSIGNFNYFYRYEVTADTKTRTKFIDFYMLWFIKEDNASGNTSLVAHSLGTPLSMAITSIE